MNKTAIEWADYTWNPITGCLNHINGMCKGGGFKCYAYGLANGRLEDRYLANPNIAIPKHLEELDLHGEDVWEYQKDPFYPRIWPERFKPLKGYPDGTKIFLDDMGDWMGPWIPAEWKMRTIDFIRAHPQYIFQTLTKQPRELPKWEFPPNCRVGVTATTANYAVAACYTLEDIKASVKFLSIEPLLAWVTSSKGAAYPALSQELVDAGINWLIIGACTGSWREMYDLQQKYPELIAMPLGPESNRWTAQPKIEWVQEIVEAADKAGIPVFLKDNLKPLLPKETRFYRPVCAGDNPCEGCDIVEECHVDSRWQILRQEFPNG